MEKRIVILNDDERILDLFTTALPEGAWELFNYSYAHCDIEKVQAHKPDLIILDFDTLDGGQGWEFLQLIKMNDLTANVPILITTGILQFSTDLQEYLLTRFIGVAHRSLSSTAFVALIQKTLWLANQADSLYFSDHALPILIVDDDEDIRENTSTILRLEGFQVHNAVNGQLALDLVSRTDYSLILLDIDMPVMNGHEFLKAYNRQLRPHSPVVIISARNEPWSPDLPVFVVETMNKPFNIKQLLGLVMKYAQPV